MQFDAGAEIRLRPRVAPFIAVIVEADQRLAAALNDQEIG
jgi:hypothetical protein